MKLGLHTSDAHSVPPCNTHTTTAINSLTAVYIPRRHRIVGALRPRHGKGPDPHTANTGIFLERAYRESHVHAYLSAWVSCLLLPLCRLLVISRFAAYVRQPDLRLYVINTFAVTQQISAVTLFLVMFMHTQDGLISVGTMVSALPRYTPFSGADDVLFVLDRWHSP